MSRLHYEMLNTSNRDKGNPNMLSLNDLKPGDNAVVTDIDTTDDDGYLMELGLMKGTSVFFVKSAPLGDPIEVNLRGFNLSIRRSKAKSIIVEKS